MHTKTLFLFRHGQTDWNKQGIVQGHTDVPLNDTGIEQAHLLGNSLIDEKIDVIISSDLIRAAHTATIVAQHIQCPVILDARLREAHSGCYQGKSKLEMMADSVWPYWMNHDLFYDTIGFPGGETKAVIKKRILDAVDHYLNIPDYQIIGISSHGVALRLALQALTNNVVLGYSFANAGYVQLNYDVQAQCWIIIKTSEAEITSLEFPTSKQDREYVDS
jgi:2,3-bisphosphoglycerate-dependent phosphoglycerate mutase